LIPLYGQYLYHIGILLSVLRAERESNPMDLLREVAPFILGILVPPAFILARRTNWPGQLKFTATFVSALVLGFCISAWAGELTGALPDAFVSVLIDTSLVYAGSQVAYWLFWKPVLEERLERRREVSAEQIHE
jgi:hypothetical protein